MNDQRKLFYSLLTPIDIPTGLVTPMKYRNTSSSTTSNSYFLQQSSPAQRQQQPVYKFENSYNTSQILIDPGNNGSMMVEEEVKLATEEPKVPGAPKKRKKPIIKLEQSQLTSISKCLFTDDETNLVDSSLKRKISDRSPNSSCARNFKLQRRN
jgi:hypothetical protein